MVVMIYYNLTLEKLNPLKNYVNRNDDINTQKEKKKKFIYWWMATAKRTDLESPAKANITKLFCRICCEINMESSAKAVSTI